MERSEAQVPIKIHEARKAGPIACEEEAFQRKVVEYNDLCTTCNCAPKCISRKNIIRPVYFCENYDDFVPQKPVEVEVGPPPRSMTEKAIQKFYGLCVNCSHRNTCAFPKPEGGIWHCEEYE